MDSFAKKTALSEEVFHSASKIMSNQMYFPGYNSMRLTHLDEHFGEGELAIVQQSLNPRGIVHGGCLTTLADTVAGIAVTAATGHVCVTVSSTMNYLKPGTGKKIKCVATPEKLGKTLCVYNVLLTDDKQEPVASGTFTFMLMEAWGGAAE